MQIFIYILFKFWLLREGSMSQFQEHFKMHPFFSFGCFLANVGVDSFMPFDWHILHYMPIKPMTLNGHFREDKNFSCCMYIPIFKMQVVVRSSNLSTKPLFANFYQANLEFYHSRSEHCLLIGQKEICKNNECIVKTF